MHCREFRRKHSGYLDDTLPGVELERVRLHLRMCERCARHDASVRRALLLVRNLPPIDPPPDLGSRIKQRLQVEGRSGGTASRVRPSRFSIGILVWGGAAAAAVALALALNDRDEQFLPQLPPAVASVGREVPVHDELVPPAFVASMSTGMPVWPALLLAEEGTLRLAASEVNWTPQRP
jgi:hypothetical protein